MHQNSFSPKARWDRFEPGKDSFDPGALNERIDAVALFKSSRIFPQSFSWNNREYRIEKIAYHWQERIGQAMVSYFSVNCAGQYYQISFNNTTFRWQIDKLI